MTGQLAEQSYPGIVAKCCPTGSMLTAGGFHIFREGAETRGD